MLGLQVKNQDRLVESGEELFNGTREQGEMCNSYCWGVGVARAAGFGSRNGLQ